MGLSFVQISKVVNTECEAVGVGAHLVVEGGPGDGPRLSHGPAPSRSTLKGGAGRGRRGDGRGAVLTGHLSQHLTCGLGLLAHLLDHAHRPVKPENSTESERWLVYACRNTGSDRSLDVSKL